MAIQTEQAANPFCSHFLSHSGSLLEGSCLHLWQGSGACRGAGNRRCGCCGWWIQYIDGNRQLCKTALLGSILHDGKSSRTLSLRFSNRLLIKRIVSAESSWFIRHWMILRRDIDISKYSRTIDTFCRLPIQVCSSSNRSLCYDYLTRLPAARCGSYEKALCIRKPGNQARRPEASSSGNQNLC